jgi:thiopeptide-type bacteriocin biosynthesis protein
MSKTTNTTTTVLTPGRFIAFRTPLLPIEELLRFSEGARAASADPGDISAALKEDRARQRAFLQEKLKDPLIRDALFIASPSLEESLNFWIEKPEGERGAKVEKSLVRYFQRMAGRSTPYGIFAGCSVGTTSDETRLLLSSRDKYRRHTRLDMHYLCALTDVLSADKEFRKGSLYTLNTSIYLSAGKLRYIESRLEQQSRERSYHLVSVEPTDYLMRIVNEAKGGISFSRCIELLVSDEITHEEAEEFVHSLIDSQILLPRLEPSATSDEPLLSVIENLTTHQNASEICKVLSDTRAKIQALDRTGLGAPAALYHEIADSLKQLPAEVDLPRLLQVDMTKEAPTASLGKPVLQELSKVISMLQRISKSSDPLRTFKEKFSQRYESREVPLVDVLDEECGIGLGNTEAAEASPLLAGLDFPGEEGEPTGDRRDWYLWGLLHQALSTSSQEITLTEKDIEALSAKTPATLPPSISAMFSVAAASDEALQRGDFLIHLPFAGGPSAANLLGRFCHADANLRQEVEAHLREEEATSPDEIFAEIVHLPPGRVGNVICRPRLRAYEIPYLGCSSATSEFQLSVQDLMISIQGGRVRLRSLKLNQYIRTRMSNAHNFATADVGLYRFLCQLRSEGTSSGVGWSWGSLEQSPFLPRVKYGKSLLHLATWRLRKNSLEKLANAKGDQIFIEAQKLRKAHQLPRRVHFAQFDNTLPVDFESVLSVETFASLIKDQPEVRLVEIFPAYEQSIAQGPEGHFVHEVVVPLLVTTPTTSSALQPKNETARAEPMPVVRSFAPGSRWFYSKMYTGTATADEVLTRVVRPITELAKEKGASRWFFIRYGDPEWHLRFRIEGDPSLLWQTIVPKWYEALAPLLESGQVWRSQLDTYDREIERYGGPGMIPSEDIFCADSEAVLSIVEKLSGDEGNDARWRLALRGMDLLLDDMGFTLKEKLSLLKRLRDNFAKEFNAEGRLERQLDTKFRAMRASLMILFDPAQEAEHPLAPGLVHLRERSSAIQRASGVLRDMSQSGTLTTTLDDLASSYLHMHANRMLRGAARNQELVLYDFLRRIYESQEARLRKGM